jgi:hypothetical protein
VVATGGGGITSTRGYFLRGGVVGNSNYYLSTQINMVRGRQGGRRDLAGLVGWGWDRIRLAGLGRLGGVIRALGACAK